MNARDDRWLTRLRALLGSGLLVWETGFDHSKHWALYVLVVWLLGGPIDKLVTLLTSGRFQIVIHDSEREAKQHEVKPPDPATKPPDPPTTPAP